MPKTILIVDDDPNIVDTARDILEDAGYSVITAGEGGIALEKLKLSPADLAIFDFNLPDVTGATLAMKAKKICPKMAILLMTGQANADLGPAKSAVAALLTKPVSPSQLIDIIQKIVDS